MGQRTSIAPLFHYVKFSLTDRWRAKCFHVKLAESPSETAPATWSRVTEGDAHSATVRWKHLAYAQAGRKEQRYCAASASHSGKTKGARPSQPLSTTLAPTD